MAAGLLDPDSPLYLENTTYPHPATGNPISKTLAKATIARALGLDRTSLYYKPKQPRKDALLAERIAAIYEQDDDTLGAKKLAKLLGAEGMEEDGQENNKGNGKPVNHKRVARVMAVSGIRPRPKAKHGWNRPGKTPVAFANLPYALENMGSEWLGLEKPDLVRSDIFEFRLADGSKVYGCFAILEQTAQVLSLTFSWRMTAELVATTINNIAMKLTEPIWHSDQGSQYGSDMVIDALVEKNYLASMSRAGTPTDNGKAERLVGIVKHSVVRRKPYHTIGELLAFAKHWINFYNERRPHESLKLQSPNAYARSRGLGIVPHLGVGMC